MSEIDDFDVYEAIFVQNIGTKLVLNCKININNAHFQYCHSVTYRSLNGSGVALKYFRIYKTYT